MIDMIKTQPYLLMIPVLSIILLGLLYFRMVGKLEKVDSKRQKLRLLFEVLSFLISVMLLFLTLWCDGKVQLYVLISEILLILLSSVELFLTLREVCTKKITPYLLMIPALVVLIVMVGYPLVYGMGISLTDMGGFNIVEKEYKFIGFKNYKKVLSEPVLYRDFVRTIVWTVVNLFFSVSIGLFLALVLNRKLPGKGIFRVLLMIPWAITQYIGVLTWRCMFKADYGAISIMLGKLGISIPWFQDPEWTFIAAIITNIWLGFPFMMAISLGGLQSIPAEIYEAAKLDGVNAWTKFKNITLPLLKPVLVPSVILSAMWTFNMVNVIFIMTSGIQSDATEILVSRVYNDAFTYSMYGPAAAKSVVIFLFLALFSSVFIKASNGGKGVCD